MNELRIILLFLIVTISSRPILGQQTDLDSLNRYLDQFDQNDPARISEMIKFAKFYITKIPGRSIDMARRAIVDATRMEESLLMAEAMKELGSAYLYLGNNDSSKYFYHQALETIEDGEATALKAALLNNIGAVSHREGEYTKGLEYFKESLNIYEKLGQSSLLISPNGNLGRIHAALGNYDTALEYYFKALLYSEEQPESIKAIAYQNIGATFRKLGDLESGLVYCKKAIASYDKTAYASLVGAYMDLGKIYIELDSLVKSEHFLKESLKTSIWNSNSLQSAQAHHELGRLYSLKKQPKKTEEHYLKAIELIESLNAPEEEAALCLSMGKFYMTQSKLKKSDYWLKKAMAVSSEFGLKDIRMMVYKSLAVLTLQLENSVKAHDYMLQYTNLRDSIFDEEKSRIISATRTKYEAKVEEIELLRKENELRKSELEAQIEKSSFQKFEIIAIASLLVTLIVLILFLLKAQTGKKQLLKNES